MPIIQLGYKTTIVTAPRLAKRHSLPFVENSRAARRSALSLDRAGKAHEMRCSGPMAEWLRRGLQILARRFDSGSGLHFNLAVLFSEHFCDAK